MNNWITVILKVVTTIRLLPIGDFNNLKQNHRLTPPHDSFYDVIVLRHTNYYELSVLFLLSFDNNPYVLTLRQCLVTLSITIRTRLLNG